MKQGEKLQYIGRILRREKGAIDYEIIDDLTPYGIEISLQRLSLDEVYRFRIYKEEGGFYTDELDTTQIKHSFYIAAALVVDDAVVVATNRASLTIETSTLGLAVAEQTTTNDYGEPSATEGTIDDGEWEYRIELARGGNNAAIDSWSNQSEISTFLFGTIIKGESAVTPIKGVDYYTEQEQQELAESLSIPRVVDFDGSYAMLPNVEYHYVDDAQSITISLASEVDGIANIYSLWFRSASTAPALVSDGIAFWNGDDVSDGALTLSANSLYEISISNSCAAVKNWGRYE